MTGNLQTRARPSREPFQADKLLDWFVPRDGRAAGNRAAYWRLHAERVAFSMSRLAADELRGRCLILGSWGAEAPCLIGGLGFSEVTCVRAPEAGLPQYERMTVSGANGQGDFECDAYALDLEREELPEHVREFDIVLMWEVMEHLAFDPAYALWQGIRAARRGGRLHFTTPNAIAYVHTVNQLSGVNTRGLRLRLKTPFATHWREYSPAEMAELFEKMGCRIRELTSFLDTDGYSWKSHVLQRVIERFRRSSGNGDCSYGRHVHAVAEKVADAPVFRPDWLCADDWTAEAELGRLND